MCGDLNRKLCYKQKIYNKILFEEKICTIFIQIYYRRTAVGVLGGSDN